MSETDHQLPHLNNDPPPAPPENQEGEVAPTTSPENDNPAGEHKLNVRAENTSSPVDVTTESNRDTSKNAADLLTCKNEALIGNEFTPRIQQAEVDLAMIAIDQDFAAMAAVKTESAAPPIKNSVGQTWFLPHPDKRLWRSFLVMKDESDKDAIYVLNPSLADDLDGEYAAVALVPCITRQDDVFFMRVKLPGLDGKIDKWNQSKLEYIIAEAGKWMRLRSNQHAERYDKLTSLKPLPPPTWPEDVQGLLTKAVSKVYIADLKHPLVQRVLGGEL